MNLVSMRPESGGHWYRPDGTPCHTVIGKNGVERNTTLADAKKLGLFPSVTTILKMWPKDNLNEWRIEQAVLAAVTLPRLENEPLDAFVGRACADAGRQLEEARVFGNLFHDAVHRYHTTGEVVTGRVGPWLNEYIAWAKENIVRVDFSERVLVGPGYAGTCDLKALMADGHTAIIDFKTQRIREDKKPNFYDTWAMQLAAYDACSPADQLVSVVINAEKPEPPRVRIWPESEAREAWTLFRGCFEFWKLVKNYNPTHESAVA
jgi:hypothetical protein